MSKPMKELMIDEYKRRLDGVNDALLISIRGVGANDNNLLRTTLLKKDIRVAVIRNNLARLAFKESGLAGLEPLLTGPTAVAWGAESVVDVARELVEWAKKVEKLELKGAILEGQLYEGAAGVERLSKMPTREEAVAQNVTLILSPGRKLVASVLGPGSSLASIVKAIEEKLEKGEAIAKVG
jgi:large subunit ribosomal protein L10